MTRPYPAALPIAYVVLRLLVVLNLLSGAAIFVLLTATIVATGWTLTALGITPTDPIRPMLIGLQAIAAMGIVAVVLNHLILKRLLQMIGTVRAGDPFVAANASRLQAIAWLLLGSQILSLAIAATGRIISTPENPLHLDAGFAASGWLAVILTFVLARVFAEGTLMRQDLEGIV